MSRSEEGRLAPCNRRNEAILIEWRKDTLVLSGSQRPGVTAPSGWRDRCYRRVRVRRRFAAGRWRTKRACIRQSRLTLRLISAPAKRSLQGAPVEVE